MILKEGIFRKPRLKTNSILKKYANLFSGKIINVSASSDKDKDCSFFDYYFGNYDNGARYKDYFTKAESYLISNYPDDETNYSLKQSEMISLDLEKEIPNNLKGEFDVVYNHTVFEHIFDIFKAFKNLCELSNDIVIFVVPQAQQIHDYRRGYKDYWRFTPFAVDELFKRNNMEVLLRESVVGFSSSIYLFYIASKKQGKWTKQFPELKELDDYITPKNDGSSLTLFSKYLLKADARIRWLINKIKRV